MKKLMTLLLVIAMSATVSLAQQKVPKAPKAKAATECAAPAKCDKAAAKCDKAEAKKCCGKGADCKSCADCKKCAGDCKCPDCKK